MKARVMAAGFLALLFATSCFGSMVAKLSRPVPSGTDAEVAAFLDSVAAELNPTEARVFRNYLAITEAHFEGQKGEGTARQKAFAWMKGKSLVYVLKWGRSMTTVQRQKMIDSLHNQLIEVRASRAAADLSADKKTALAKQESHLSATRQALLDDRDGDDRDWAEVMTPTGPTPRLAPR